MAVCKARKNPRTALATVRSLISAAYTRACKKELAPTRVASMVKAPTKTSLGLGPGAKCVAVIDTDGNALSRYYRGQSIWREIYIGMSKHPDMYIEWLTSTEAVVLQVTPK